MPLLVYPHNRSRAPRCIARRCDGDGQWHFIINPPHLVAQRATGYARPLVGLVNDGNGCGIVELSGRRLFLKRMDLGKRWQFVQIL